MIKLVIVGSLALISQARVHYRQSEMREHPINENIINHVKQMTTTWTPHEVHENPLKHLSLSELHQLLGTTLQDPLGYDAPTVISVPTSFDPRTKWPNCIHDIRD